MRSLVNRCLAGALTCASVVACMGEEREQSKHPVSTPTVDAVGSRPTVGVTNEQPESPEQAISPSVPEDSFEPPEPSLNVVPPAMGPTEPQVDVRSRATQVLSVASAQIDRLRRMGSTAPDLQRQNIEATLGDLQGRRQRVLEDLKELEMAPAGATADIRVLLDRDVAGLQNGLRASYAIAPALSEGLPQPSPLAPSAIP